MTTLEAFESRPENRGIPVCADLYGQELKFNPQENRENRRPSPSPDPIKRGREKEQEGRLPFHLEASERS
jgi:hypothetical protein